MRRWLFENSLSIAFLVLFLATVVGQSFAGQHAFNQDQRAHGGAQVTWHEYLTSTQFARAVMENWQSEFLQFFLFILITVWLVQQGSNESKDPSEIGTESDQKQRVKGYAPPNAPGWAKLRDWRRRVYENSLLLTMLAIFLLSWLAQSLTGWRAYNDEQLEHHAAVIGWGSYLTRSDFWESTLQNWQSEFLAVGSMAVFTIYLRQRGSPESKPVGAPHHETSSSG
jgi:Domain of unknown function (DUF6766)